jgi:hypothetical protein
MEVCHRFAHILITPDLRALESPTSVGLKKYYTNALLFHYGSFFIFLFLFFIFSVSWLTNKNTEVCGLNSDVSTAVQSRMI